MNRKNINKIIMLSSMVLGLSACGSRTVVQHRDGAVTGQEAGGGREAGSGVDGPSMPEAGVIEHDKGTTPRYGWVFKPDSTTGKNKRIYLKLKSISSNKALIQVMIRQVSQLQGVAFRLAFPTTQVKVTANSTGALWNVSSVGYAHQFALQAEGELWAGFSFLGRHGAMATADSEVARLQLTLSGTKAIKLAFRAGRNMAADINLKPLPVSWLGGTFVWQKK